MELLRALGALCESPRPELQRIAEVLDLGPLPGRAAHADLFLFQLYPYAAVYLGAEGMMGGEAGDRIAGFWRALGQAPPPEPDHLASLLGLAARLGELEAAAADRTARRRWRHARAAFLWEHLASWLPVFLIKLGGLAGVADPFYLRWAAMLSEALREEAAALPYPGILPLHLRAAPDLADPRRDGAAAFLGSLLSPVRSGVVVARADLAHAAHELGLGLRLGERRVILEAMLDQDAAGTLGWLATEAAAWAARHRPDLHLAPPLAHFWQSRAAATARRAGELREAIER